MVKEQDIIKYLLGDESRGKKILWHVHSNYSNDGISTPRDMLETAKAKGYEGIALADHDTIDGLEDALEAAEELDMNLICGTEISTKDGHLLAYWPKDKVPEYIPEPDKPVKETIAELRKQGAVTVAAHPWNPVFLLGWSLGSKAFYLDVDAVEDRNCGVPPISYHLCNFLNKYLSNKHNKDTISGSDAHATWEISEGRVPIKSLIKSYLKRAKEGGLNYKKRADPSEL